MSTESAVANPGDSTTVAESVFARIYDLILLGELKPGEVIKESVLSVRFGVSRGPVREAVNRLRGLGLVEKEAYGRAHVSELTLETVIEIFQLREVVEGLAARLTAENATSAQLDALLVDYKAWQSQPSDGDFDLHVRLAKMSGNEYVERLFCNELNYQLRRYRMLSGEAPGRHGDASTEHWQILRAIHSRDGELAESLMRSHIKRARYQLSNVLGDT